VEPTNAIACLAQQSTAAFGAARCRIRRTTFWKFAARSRDTRIRCPLNERQMNDFAIAD
jgi:hypothetical protein